MNSPTSFPQRAPEQPASAADQFHRARSGDRRGQAPARTDVQAPIKKKRGQQVTFLGKAYSHLLSVLRMPVEHHFARLQKFGCRAGLWRGPQSGHEDIFCVVSGLLNFRATGRFELA